MYPQKQMLYILTMLEAIEKIFIYVGSIQSSEELLWKHEQQIFNACSHLLLAIGEESKKLCSELKQEHTEVDWKALAGLRDRLAHDYRGTDPDIVFSVIKEYLPNVKNTLIKCVKQTENNNLVLSKILDSPYYRHLSYLTEN